MATPNPLSVRRARIHASRRCRASAISPLLSVIANPPQPQRRRTAAEWRLALEQSFYFGWFPFFLLFLSSPDAVAPCNWTMAAYHVDGH